MKFILYTFAALILMGVGTVFWLNNVPVVRVLEVYKVNAHKAFEVDRDEGANLFFVPEAAIVNGKVRLVRAGHVAEVTVAPTPEPQAPEGKVTVLAPLQDREMVIIPPYKNIPVGAQVRGERLGSGYSTLPIKLTPNEAQ